MNIYEKIRYIMAQVEYIQKDDHVQFKTTNYKALSEEKITSIMHKQFVDQGLLVFPVEQSWTRTGDITHVDVKYRIVNAENPEEFIEVVSCGDGFDTQDKGSGKAMTYAFKYMWLRTFAIPTGEDPDKMSNEEIEANKAKVEAANKVRAEAKTKAKITQDQIDYAKKLCEEKGMKGCPGYGSTLWEDMTIDQYLKAVEELKKVGAA